jgi:Amt family ammonium transporter
MLELASRIGRLETAGDAAWVVTATALVLVMQAGFALLTCGLVRRKNAAHLVMLNLASFVISLLAYASVGFAFQFGAVGHVSGLPNLASPAVPTGGFLVGSGVWGILGGRGFLLSARSLGSVNYSLVLFKGAVMATAGFILVGAVCERITFRAFVASELFLSAVLAPMFGCWTWGGGWLARLGSSAGWGHGYVDFAGSTVVHAVGGFSAMALAIVLGPRVGKFGPRGETRAFPAHNVVYVGAGTLILLCGWVGFDAGASLSITNPRLALVALNTLIAAAAASAAAMCVWYWLYAIPDISMACNGLLAGLVAIAAPCIFVGPGAALTIGLMAGAVVSGGVLFNDRIVKVDDPCGTIAVHGYCGWLGAVSVGIFADGSYGAGWNGVGALDYLGRAGQGVTGLLYGDASQLLVQLVGASLSVVYAASATYLFCSMLNVFRPIRVSREVELEGLDLPEFGMLAYPEEDPTVA